MHQSIHVGRRRTIRPSYIKRELERKNLPFSTATQPRLQGNILRHVKNVIDYFHFYSEKSKCSGKKELPIRNTKRHSPEAEERTVVLVPKQRITRVLRHAPLRLDFFLFCSDIKVFLFRSKSTFSFLSISSFILVRVKKRKNSTECHSPDWVERRESQQTRWSSIICKLRHAIEILSSFGTSKTPRQSGPMVRSAKGIKYYSRADRKHWYTAGQYGQSLSRQSFHEETVLQYLFLRTSCQTIIDKG